ncbi:MAG: hypothetical protein ACI9S8_003168 [Chlamydiales bacterium]
MARDLKSEPRKVFDVIRKEWVAATPEEIIRQKLIHHMIEELGYPQHFIAVEKALRELPHLQLYGTQVPDRRVDLICFAKDITSKHPLYPLIVVECKAVNITKKVLSQVEGYNHFLKACFVAVANGEEMRTGWYDATLGKYQYVDMLPKFNDLLLSVAH